MEVILSTPDVQDEDEGNGQFDSLMRTLQFVEMTSRRAKATLHLLSFPISSYLDMMSIKVRNRAHEARPYCVFEDWR